MDTAERPPDEVFCMECGPGAVMAPDRPAGVLRCRRCGAARRLPGHPLFVVTGASGTGKTTVMEPLRRRLGDLEVFETDTILQVATLGWDTWRNTWLQLAHAVALNGRASVLCGSLLPAQLEELPARRLVGPIHFCTLDCPDPVLAERLRVRPAWRGSSEEAAIVEHLRFAAWLRAHIRPAFDTSILSAEETADHIAEWVRQRLASAPPSPTAAASG